MYHSYEVVIMLGAYTGTCMAIVQLTSFIFFLYSNISNMTIIQSKQLWSMPLQIEQIMKFCPKHKKIVMLNCL